MNPRAWYFSFLWLPILPHVLSLRHLLLPGYCPLCYDAVVSGPLVLEFSASKLLGKPLLSVALGIAVKVPLGTLTSHDRKYEYPSSPKR